MNYNRRSVTKKSFGYTPMTKRTLSFDDDSANDGYESDDRLVIDVKKQKTSAERNDSSHDQIPVNDFTEKWINQIDGPQKGEAQLFQLDIGSGCYFVAKPYNGQLLVHIRKYEKNDEGRLYPTKKGIALNLEKWKKFSECVSEEIDRVIHTYRENQPVNFMFDLGDDYYVSVNSGHPLVNIRRWFVPQDQQELKPTRTGIALPFWQWEKLKMAMIVAKDMLTVEQTHLGFCQDIESHQNLLSALNCGTCNPGFKME